MGMFDDLIPDQPPPPAGARMNAQGQLEIDITRPDVAPPAPANRKGLFDDLIPKQPNYDPMAIAAASANAREYTDQQKQTPFGSAPAQGNKGAGNALMQGHIDTEAAYSQHAAPLVRDIKGNFVRKPIGDIEHYDFGPVIRGADGNVLAFNPTSDVMLRDPQSGKLMAFERDQQMDKPGLLTRLGQAILPGMVAGPPTRLASSNAIPMAVQRGAALGFPVSAKTMQLGERVRDAAAFREIGAADEVFAPAFRSKGAARFARTVEEMPVMGGIVKNPKTETEMALRDAQGRIASELGAAPTDEAAGRVMQGGLDRFKNDGVSRIEPGVLAERGIEPRAPVQPQPFMSGPALDRAGEAAPIREALGGGRAQTTRGVDVPAARRLDEAIIARRGPADMSDAEIQTLIRTPAAETSFATRQEALFENAWRSIPAQFRIDASRNPQRLAAVNTRAALNGIDENIAHQIAGQRTITGDLADRIRNARAHFDMGDLRAMRTEVGRALASMDPQQTRLNQTQLRNLYAGLSRDIEVGLQDIANRAYLLTRVGGNRPDRVAVEAARRADQALRDFRVADRYTRLGMDRMSRFARVLGAQSPEAAVRTLATRMREGTIDRGTIRAIAEALRPEERNQILGYLIARMGQGRHGAQEAESVWNLHTFATDWSKNREGLALLLRDAPAGVRERLEALARISGRMKYYETTKNYSGSAYAGIPFMGVATGAVGGGPAGILTAIGGVGGIAAVGKFLTTPRFLDWMVKEALAGVPGRVSGPAAAAQHWPQALVRLQQLAANDNELGPVVSEAIALVNKRAVGAEGEEPQDQGGRR